jgi:hypothetical protein
MNVWLLCACLAAQPAARVVVLNVGGTLEKPALSSLQGAMVVATQKALLQRYQVVDGAGPTDAAARVDVQVRGDRAYVRVTGEGVSPTVARVPAKPSARGGGPMTWTGPLREERVMDVADAVTDALLHPRRPAPDRGRGSRVEVSVVDLDVEGPDRDILLTEAQVALPVLAACLDRLKVNKPARDVELKVAWDAAGAAAGVQVADFDDEPVLQQCLTLQGRVLSVPSTAGRPLVGTLTLHVVPVR